MNGSSSWLDDSSESNNSSAYVLDPTRHHSSSSSHHHHHLHHRQHHSTSSEYHHPSFSERISGTAVAAAADGKLSDHYYNTQTFNNSDTHQLSHPLLTHFVNNSSSSSAYWPSFSEDGFEEGGGGSGLGSGNDDDGWGLMGSGSGVDEGAVAVSWDLAFRDSSRFWVQYVLVPIVVIIGVMGNAVTIYILTRKPMRSSTNVYLTALAVSDLLFLLFSFSMSWRHYPSVNTIWFYWWYTPFGLWITDASSSTSVWLTVSFTIERYIAVCHPMRGKIYCTEERAIRVAIAVYLLCFAVTASTPFEWRAAVAPNQTGPLNETIYMLESTEFGNNETYRLIYHWFTTIFFVLLPVVILAIFNFFLIQAVRRSRIARKDMTNQQMSSVRQLQTIRQENRITIILIVVVIVFLICQMPTALVLIYTSIHISDYGTPEYNVLLGLGNIFNLLVAINASCNFLLYTALSDKYRKYFCAFFLCRRRRKSPSNPRQFNGSPYELDTMDTTLSLSRGTSLRMDFNIVNDRRKSSATAYGLANNSNGALRRTHTYNNANSNGVRNNNNHNRSHHHHHHHHHHNGSSGSGGGRKNIHISMKDPTIPLIQVDQV